MADEQKLDLASLQATYARSTPDWISGDTINGRVFCRGAGQIATFLDGWALNGGTRKANAECAIALHNAFPALAVEIESLRADKERLDLLEDLVGFEVYRVLQSECTGYMRVIAANNHREREGKTLRHAVDALRQALDSGKEKTNG